AVKLASIPDEIRGYGHVKARNVALAKAKQSQLLAEFRNPQAAAQTSAQAAAASAQVVRFT
ncbi:MAG: hypothetical protein RBR77_10915, partial [Thauera sp.]|nr:hypothetical protein [Thauera sp.]